jgi:hypothetical protein
LQYLRDNGIGITEWTTKRDLSPEELVEFCKDADALPVPEKPDRSIIP